MYRLWWGLTLVLGLVQAVDLDINQASLICDAAKAMAQGQWNYYEGTRYGGTVGMFDGYYWWAAGQLFGGLLDYYSWCEPTNDTLKLLIYEGMYHQRGEDNNYIPSNQLMTEGNDDQGMWGLTLMEAVERNFTDPPDVLWLFMAQSVFNTMNSRWDTKNCGGGLIWQIFAWNAGYDYKNLISNGCLFFMGARLARYLGKDNNYTQNYTDTCDLVWNWMESVGFMNLDDANDRSIYDGAKINNNCSINETTKLKWSYTYGVFMAGLAYLYNLTGNDTWKNRAYTIMHAGLDYFVDQKGFMQEMTCFPGKWCNNDQKSFRALWLRCLQLTLVLIPEFSEKIMPFVQKLAQGAAKSCSGGSDGITCGMDWLSGNWDGDFGLGEQQSALEVTLALLAHLKPPPLTENTGGTSKLDPQAGLNTTGLGNSGGLVQNKLDIQTKDKGGAGFITAFVLIVLLATSTWMMVF